MISENIYLTLTIISAPLAILYIVESLSSLKRAGYNTKSEKIGFIIISFFMFLVAPIIAIFLSLIYESRVIFYLTTIVVYITQIAVSITFIREKIIQVSSQFYILLGVLPILLLITNTVLYISGSQKNEITFKIQQEELDKINISSVEQSLSDSRFAETVNMIIPKAGSRVVYF